MADIAALFGVIGVSLAVAFATELIQYLLIYRTSNFRTLKANLEKHAAKVEVARDASTSRAVKKREARLQGWEEEAGRQLAAANFKSGGIVSKPSNHHSILATISSLIIYHLIPRPSSDLICRSWCLCFSAGALFPRFSVRLLWSGCLLNPRLLCKRQPIGALKAQTLGMAQR